MPNVPLLEKTMDYIVCHPEEHDQSFWVVERACGTTRCFAGTAAMLAGYTMSNGACFVAADDNLGQKWKGKFVANVGDIAQRELGLSVWQAQRLFSGATTIDELQLVVKDIANEQRIAQPV